MISANRAKLLKILSVLTASALLLIQFSILCVADDTTSKTVNILDWSDYVESAGTSSENWSPAISAAIDYAVQNAYDTVYIPAGRYPCDASSDRAESWEKAPAAIYLPDYALTIKGDGESTVLYKGRGTINAMAMFRTTYNGTSAINLKNLKVLGKYNPGSSSGLVDGIVINGSSNMTIDNVYIQGTKRHGVYAMCGASNNTINNLYVDNSTREMLGCALQFEGASNNYVSNIHFTNIGSNGIDFNEWNTSDFYPAFNGTNGSPYIADEEYYSTNNIVSGGYISGTGLLNGGLGGGAATCNPDDDYYGINLIGQSNGNNISLDYIENVRISGTNSNACAIRLMNVNSNTVTIKQVKNSSNFVASLNSKANNNNVTVENTSGIQGNVLCVVNNLYGNNIMINDETDYAEPDSSITSGYTFSNWQDNWQTSGSTISCALVDDGIHISAGTATYVKLTRNLNFDYPYVILKFRYKTNTSFSTIGLNEYPWTALSGNLLTDGEKHEMSVIIPYTDGQQNIMFSPNNTSTSISDAYLEISDLCVYNHRGQLISGDNVLRTAVNFQNGEAGVLKSVQVNLYSNSMRYAPSRLGLMKTFVREGNLITANVPICSNDWVLKYDYAVSDDIVGLGNIQVQEGKSWYLAGSADTNHSAGLYQWTEETISLAKLGGTQSYGKELFALALSCSTKDAVDTSKTYYAYYRNIRIEDSSGNTMYNFFDDSVTTSELCPQVWGSALNATMDLSVVDKMYSITTSGNDKGNFNIPFTASAGEIVEMSVTPYSGYKLNNVTSNNVSILSQPNGFYEFIMPQSDIIVSADYISKIKGDIIENDIVDTTDMVLLRKILLGIPCEVSYDSYTADVNADNKITVSDLVKIKKMIALIF